MPEVESVEHWPSLELSFRAQISKPGCFATEGRLSVCVPYCYTAWPGVSQLNQSLHIHNSSCVEQQSTAWLSQQNRHISSSNMLGRISRGLGHKTGKKGVKYRFDVVVEKLDNLPSPVKKCRVVWSRGPKLQMTEIRDVNKGKLAGTPCCLTHNKTQHSVANVSVYLHCWATQVL